MLPLALVVVPVIGLGLIMLAAFARSGPADDASDEVFGDVAQLPRGLIRKRPPSFIDITITRFGGASHHHSNGMKGR